MKKTTLLKTIVLAAVMMLGGAGSAWATTSTLYNWGTTTDGGATVWTDAEKGNWTGTTPSIDATNGLGLSTKNTSLTTCTRTLSIDETAILTYTAEWYIKTDYSADNYAKFTLGDFLTLNMYGSQRLSVTVNGTESSLVTPSAKTTTFTVSCTVNTVTNTITAFSVKEGETDRLTMAHLTEGTTCTLLSAHNYTTVSLSEKSSNNSREISSCLKRLKIVQDTQVLTKYAYTVNYKENDKIVKSVSGTGYEGSYIPTASATSAFYGDDRSSEAEATDYSSQKFFIIADAAPSQTITTNPASNVLDIPVRRPFSVKSIQVRGRFDGESGDGTLIKGSGVLTESDAKEHTYNCFFPLYYEKDSKWYRATLDDGKYGRTVSYADHYDDVIKYFVEYSLDENVVYFDESKFTGTNNRFDKSNGNCKSGTGTQTITSNSISLESGAYKLQLGTFTYNLCTVKQGETTLGTIGSQGYVYFTMASDGETTFTFTGSMRELDYFYIEKVTTMPVTAVDNLGYTFSCPVPLDFTGTEVEAYTAAYNSTSKKVELNRVYKVPANTGLFIKGSADNIPVLTGDADDMGTNNLIAVSATTTVNQTDGDNTNFVLGVDNAAAPTAAVFLKAPTAGVSVGAGKAYLQIPTASAPEAARMAVVFGDEDTTGIESVATVSQHGGQQDCERIYSLQGQRVEKPTKDLYIVNGKKVIVK